MLKVLQNERQNIFESADNAHISTIVLDWKDQICISSTNNLEFLGKKKKCFLCSQA